MSKPIVFLTRILPKPVMVQLESTFDLRFDPADKPLSKDQLLEGIKPAEGIISMLSDFIDEEVLAAAPALKIVANYAVGYNNIDVPAAKAQQIAVTNTPGVLTESTADLCWALLMAVARRIPEANLRVKSGHWSGWSPTEMLGFDVFGKTLGLVGMGRIAQALARRAAGFGMQVLYFSRHQVSKTLENDLKISYSPLSQLLEQSDYVSLHVPLNEASRHLIDQKSFQLMKSSAFLINTARGPVIDEEALVQALLEKQIAGAGLDVYEAEPTILPQLLQMENVVTLPHIGSASLETRVKMGFIVIENLKAAFAGQNPPNVVD